jgi:hypothetical protein
MRGEVCHRVTGKDRVAAGRARPRPRRRAAVAPVAAIPIVTTLTLADLAGSGKITRFV